MSTLPLQLAKSLGGASPRLAKAPVLVGLDGFIDTILHVVDQRQSPTHYTRMTKMGTFAKRIHEAAGLSANFEFVPQLVKLGGNGPIMANCLLTGGTPLTYIGCLGAPGVHPVFADLAKRAAVHSICDPGLTDAIEFEDGKLMCGKHQTLRQVNWANLIRHLPEPKLLKLFNSAALVALVNWTMLPLMSELFKKILTRVAPRMTGPRRWLFIDLADPAKRTPEDIRECLRQITRFEKYFNVILGLNLPEARQIGAILGLPLKEDALAPVTAHAAALREALGIHTVVVHPTAFAAGADATGATHVLGPYTAKPKITTGAGDHFNAGFCLARLLDLPLDLALQQGVATSGFYVRNAKSPTLPALKKFLASL